MSTISKALQHLTDYLDGADEDGATKAADILHELGGKKRKPHEDGYLNSVLAIEWRNIKGPKPKLYLDVKASYAQVSLVLRGVEESIAIPLAGEVLTTETLRAAASTGIRVLADRFRKRPTGSDR